MKVTPTHKTRADGGAAMVREVAISTAAFPHKGEQLNREQYVKTPEAAVITGVPVATLETLRSRGGGSRFVRIGRSVYYRISDLLDWMDANARTSTSDSGKR